MWNSIFPWKMQALTTVHGVQQWTRGWSTHFSCWPQVPLYTRLSITASSPDSTAIQPLPPPKLVIALPCCKALKGPQAPSGFKLLYTLASKALSLPLSSLSPAHTPHTSPWIVLSFQYSAYHLVCKLLNPRSPQLGRTCCFPHPWPSDKL